MGVGFAPTHDTSVSALLSLCCLHVTDNIYRFSLTQNLRLNPSLTTRSITPMVEA